jgi:hypothetical protein
VRYADLKVYNFASALAKIVDDDSSDVDRAVRTFEFHVALLCCDGPAKDINALAVRVSKRRLREARLFALMKLSDYSLGTSKLALSKDSKNSAINEVIQHLAPSQLTALIHEILEPFALIRREGGWRSVQALPSDEDFAKELATRRKELDQVGLMLDLSLRVDEKGLKRQRLPGFSRSLKVMSETTVTGAQYSPSALKRRYKRYRPVSIIGYLLQFQGFQGPAHLLDPNFTARLLEITHDKAAWRQLISSYRHVRDLLEDRNYKGLPRLRVRNAGELPPPAVSWGPLDSLTQAAMQG